MDDYIQLTNTMEICHYVFFTIYLVLLLLSILSTFFLTILIHIQVQSYRNQLLSYLAESLLRLILPPSLSPPILLSLPIVSTHTSCRLQRILRYGIFYATFHGGLGNKDKVLQGEGEGGV